MGAIRTEQRRAALVIGDLRRDVLPPSVTGERPPFVTRGS
jgi:hypothetical protein